MSLKWRIALGYSVLLIVALTAMSGLLVWRFQQILDDQAETTVNATMRTIVQFAQQLSLIHICVARRRSLRERRDPS